MKSLARTMLAGLALATAAIGVSAPGQARTYVELGIRSYDGGYHDPYYREGYRGGYYHDGYRYRDWDRDRWERRRHREWRRHHGYYRDGYRYRDRCWTEWRWTRYDGRVPVRICR